MNRMKFLKTLASIPILGSVAGCRVNEQEWIADALRALDFLSCLDLPYRSGSEFTKEIEVKAGDSIAEALRGVKTGPNKRCLVRVGQGTYREKLDFQSWPDLQHVSLMGKDREKCVITWDRDDGDTITMGGTNIEIDGFTVIHETEKGEPCYAIHADKRQESGEARWMISNCTLIGKSRKSGLGVGMHADEFGIVCWCKVTSDFMQAANLHNKIGPAKRPSRLLISSCQFESTAKTELGFAAGYYNMGTGQPDIVAFQGCKFDGPAGKLRVENRRGGAGETLVLINDDGLDGAKLVDPSKRVSIWETDTPPRGAQRPYAG